MKSSLTVSGKMHDATDLRLSRKGLVSLRGVMEMCFVTLVEVCSVLLVVYFLGVTSGSEFTLADNLSLTRGEE